MTTATISPEFNPATLPVEIKTAEEAGKAWLEQAGQLPIMVDMKNDWKITEAPDGGLPQLRMNFRATTEDGRQFQLFQDLLEGKWYRELAPSAPVQLQ